MNSKTKITLLLIGIFLCGILLGVGGTLVAEKAIIKRTLENPEKARHLLARRVSRQLDLNAEQAQRIKLIIGEQSDEFARIRLDAADDVESVFADTYDKILPVLDESQKVKFEKMFKLMMFRFRKTYYSGIPESMTPISGEGSE